MCLLHFQEGPWCLQPGYNVRQDILNVMTTNKNSFYYTMDSQLGVVQKVPYYNCTDLFIGQVLNVYGRSIILVSCDEFTKSFYTNVYQLGEGNTNNRLKSNLENNSIENIQLYPVHFHWNYEHFNYSVNVCKKNS